MMQCPQKNILPVQNFSVDKINNNCTRKQESNARGKLANNSDNNKQPRRASATETERRTNNETVADGIQSRDLFSKKAPVLCHAGFLHWFVARSVATWQCPMILAGCCLDKWQGRWGRGGGGVLFFFCSFIFYFLIFYLSFSGLFFGNFFSHLLRLAFLFIYLLFSHLLLIFFFGLVLCLFFYCLLSPSFLSILSFTFLSFTYVYAAFGSFFFFPSAFLFICLLLSYLLLIFLLAFGPFFLLPLGDWSVKNVKACVYKWQFLVSSFFTLDDVLHTWHIPWHDPMVESLTRVDTLLKSKKGQDWSEFFLIFLI
jgi:hypothetical protein